MYVCGFVCIEVYIAIDIIRKKVVTFNCTERQRGDFDLDIDIEKLLKIFCQLYTVMHCLQAVSLGCFFQLSIEVDSRDSGLKF